MNSITRPLPLPLYRTHKHICIYCGQLCHIIHEINKTDCICNNNIHKKSNTYKKK